MSETSKQIISIQDERVFETIFRDHYQALVGFAVKYVRDDDVAEGIVQETFANLWVKSKTITIKTSLKAYLYGAVRNGCLNYLKHEKVKKAYSEYRGYHFSEQDETDHLELDELESTIRKAFEKVPPKCREIFELSRFEGKKYQEIAELLDLSIKTVENQMGKALKILRDELKDYLILIIWLMLYGGNF